MQVHESFTGNIVNGLKSTLLVIVLFIMAQAYRDWNGERFAEKRRECSFSLRVGSYAVYSSAFRKMYCTVECKDCNED